ncbi:hypothetical protein K505DRAFT_57568 [Melanomma pulvis-pyrius CBS 109.77]|uniref:Glycine zipper 2TM domain-containing protein n=1 Tax=Melanomma pulvis-pyrius CBS 109.77 TaxID=1314802 RepID=A0A6A6X725_9PLEO|nr:hypothetical protein K505DRAFT_57568 [Melanomma pulvis-pyrius CBS 109.77]
MAAAEYYFGSSGALNQNRPNPVPPQQPQPQYPYQLQPPPQSNQQLNAFSTPPPSYSPYAPSHQPQSYSAQSPQQEFPPPPLPNSRLPTSAPYPQTPPMGPQKYPLQPQAQQNGYLGAPLQQYRSHSQPPRVHFADGKTSSDFSDDYSSSDSDSSRRRSHRERRHRSSHSTPHRGRSHSSSLECDRGYDYEQDRSRRSKPQVEHKSRDMFLGAGAGGLVGDMIFPGLGTVGGLLLGGYGGRKHAQKRSKSHTGEGEGRRRGGGDGWDERTATYRKGHAVR